MAVGLDSIGRHDRAQNHCPIACENPKNLNRRAQTAGARVPTAISVNMKIYDLNRNQLTIYSS